MEGLIPKIVTIATLKGGVGKTTVLTSIAGRIAKKKRTLLIDCDAQANLTSNIGLDIAEESYASIQDIFENRETKPEQVIFRNLIEELPNLDIIPSNILLTTTEYQMVSSAGRERRLANWIMRNKDYLNENYDLILCDTNPSMNVINQNAFYIADAIVLISDVDFNSVTGAEAFCGLWETTCEDLEKEYNVKALILNNAKENEKLTKDIIANYQQSPIFKDIFISQIIPSTVAFKNATLDGLPLNLYLEKMKKSPEPAYVKANNAVEAVVKELEERGIL